jgi:type II secretory pathway predicted ATPase ExeA
MAAEFGLAVNIATGFDLLIKVGVQCSAYCSGVKTAPREVRDILHEVDKLGNTLEEVGRLLQSPDGEKIKASQNIHTNAEDCQSHLAALTSKLGARTTWKRLRWPLQKQEVADVVAKLERCRSAILLDLQIYQISSLATVHQEIVLAKIRTVERAGFNAHADTDNARCYHGTRTEVLGKISTWGNTGDGKHIFWLNGKAGTGKSTISRSIAQTFADKGVLGASFFFKRGEGDRGLATFFFPTIVAQLIQQLPPMAPLVRNEST